MNFYVLLTIFFALLLIRHRKYPSRIGVLISFMLCFLSAFRGENVGHDTTYYIDIEYIRQSAGLSITSWSDFSDIDNSIEIISNYINKIVYTLNLNGQWVVIQYAIIMIVFLYMSCKRLKVNATYTMAFFVILGYFFYSLSACRQISAVCVIMYAMTYLKENNNNSRLFFIWIIVAIMIHSASFICVLLYLVRLLPKTLSYKKVGWGVFVMSILLTLSKNDFLNQMSILASSEHFSDYLEGYGQTSTSLSSLVGCWVETGCLFYFFLKKKRGEIEKEMTVFDYLFLMSFFVNAALLQYDGLVARVKYNLVIMQCCYLAQLFVNKSIWNYQSNIMMLIFMMLRVMKNYYFEVALESDYYFCFI